jgi:hypothetical protein
MKLGNQIHGFRVARGCEARHSSAGHARLRRGFARGGLFFST